MQIATQGQSIGMLTSRVANSMYRNERPASSRQPMHAICISEQINNMNTLRICISVNALSIMSIQPLKLCSVSRLWKNDIRIQTHRWKCMHRLPYKTTEATLTNSAEVKTNEANEQFGCSKDWCLQSRLLIPYKHTPSSSNDQPSRYSSSVRWNLSARISWKCAHSLFGRWRTALSTISFWGVWLRCQVLESSNNIAHYRAKVGLLLKAHCSDSNCMVKTSHWVATLQQRIS